MKKYQDDTTSNTHDNMLYHVTWYIQYTRTSFGPGFPLNNTRNVVQKKKNQELCRRAFLNPQGSLYYQPKHNMHFEGANPPTPLQVCKTSLPKIHGWHLYNDPSSTFRSMFQGIAAKSAEKWDFWCKSSVRKSICSVTSPSRYDVALDPFKHGWWTTKRHKHFIIGFINLTLRLGSLQFGVSAPLNSFQNSTNFKLCLDSPPASKSLQQMDL